METIGSAIDKLTIANIRLWHLEDRRRDRSLTDSEWLEAADQVSEVNSERNQLIEEIGRLLHQAVVAGKAAVVTKNKLI
jgi:hypothetical protein